MPLIVAHAASEYLSIALGGLERRRIPELERLWRLDIIVVVEEKRSIRPTFALSVDNRKAFCRLDLYFKSSRSQQFCGQFGTLRHADILRGDAGLGA